MFGIDKQQFGNPTPNRHECVKQICAVGAWATHKILVLQTRTEHKRGWLFDGQFLDSHPIEHGKSLNPEQITWGAETCVASFNRCFFNLLILTLQDHFWPFLEDFTDLLSRIKYHLRSGHWHAHLNEHWILCLFHAVRATFLSWLGDHLTMCFVTLLSKSG